MATMNPPLDISADPLIAEAKQRARRRRLLALAAAGLIAAGLLVFDLAPSGSGGGVHGTIPWLSTKPSVGPANPPLAPPCTATQLHGSLDATGSSNDRGPTQEYGTIELVNRSSTACALVGSPSFSAEGWRMTRYRSGKNGDLDIPRDPLAPPVGSLRALRPGAHVLALLRVPGCTQAMGDARPLRALALAAPAGGQITFAPPSSTFVSCNAPAGTTVKVTPYVPYVPTSKKRSSELPLSARIVHTGSDRRFYYGTIGRNGKDIGDPNVAAGAGRWLSYTVVLKNRSTDVFRFGATCPSYTESVDRKSVAYVLNCHPVGAIDPGKSVRFAMRVRLPRHPPGHWQAQLYWELSPHSYNPPAAGAAVVGH
jgi:hypothetical protein